MINAVFYNFNLPAKYLDICKLAEMVWVNKSRAEEDVRVFSEAQQERFEHEDDPGRRQAYCLNAEDSYSNRCRFWTARTKNIIFNLYFQVIKKIRFYQKTTELKNIFYMINFLLSFYFFI